MALRSLFPEEVKLFPNMKKNYAPGTKSGGAVVHVLSQCSYKLIGLWLALLAFTPGLLQAEGVNPLAPQSDDMVMLLIGNPDFGRFATYDGPENSRLYIRIKEAGEVVYLGLSREYTAAGVPQSAGPYQYRIRRASDGAVVHGPFTVNNTSENVTGWADAFNGPFELTGQGYQTTNSQYRYVSQEAGLYYIEFTDVTHIGYWDITVGKDGQRHNGRVYSRNWAFRTPAEVNVQPECVWDREFNGVLYSYTSDGFVTRIDFAESGFQGLSFNVAFNRKGPGTSGNAELDRMSVSNQNLTQNSAEHLIFLNEPDVVLFPDGQCGEVQVASFFQCNAAGGYCLDVSVTLPGQVEVILDVNRNGLFDPATERRLIKVFEPGDPLSACVPWDGLLADGSAIPEDARINLMVQYTQGVQHWALFDAEFLKNGFCIDVVRPICTDNASGSLYWDDRNISLDPGTAQPKDGRGGCDCETANCRYWTNFVSNNSNCLNINDNLTVGYGDKSTLNTWWYATTHFETVVDVPLSSATISGSASLCELATGSLTLNWQASSAITGIRWIAPNGSILAEGDGSLTTVTINTPGLYLVEVTDASACINRAEYRVEADNCPADLSLDLTASNLNPAIGEVVSFSIVVQNEGPGAALNFSVDHLLPVGFSLVGNPSHGGTAQANGLNWTGLSLLPGASITLSFTAVVVASNSPGAYSHSAEITTSLQPDPDSTPGNGPDTDADGQCADDSGDEDDADCLVLVPQACAVSLSLGAVVCQDNGTPVNPADDTFTVALLINGSNTSTGWTSQAPSGLSGAYGTTTVFGPFSIAAGNANISIRDNIFATCTQSISVAPPATCSNQCDISAQLLEILCDDAGTPSLADDDTYTVQVRVSGFNTSSTWTSPGGWSGAYGVPVVLGPYAIADGNIALVFSDASQANCTYTLDVSAPPSCSGACAIQPAVISNLSCDDNGTPAFPGDDTFTFSLRANGYNTSGSWITSQGRAGAFGQTYTFGPYPISAGNVSFQLWDTESAECVTFVVVTPPATCSNQCDIEAIATEVRCLDNGTPSDASDDRFRFALELRGINNPGPAWSSPQLGLGFYGQTYDNLPDFPISAGTQTFEFVDATHAGCTTTLSVAPPATCSNTCQLSPAVVSQLVCNDNGTPADPADDTFTFQLSATGFNTSGSWTTSQGRTGIFGQTYTFGPYAISNGNVSFQLWDSQSPSCVTFVLVTPPATCSNQCVIAASATNILCLDNSTPYDPSDDQFTFDLKVEGINNPGQAWTSTTFGLGFYGQVYSQRGPFPISAGAQTFSFASASQAGCTTQLEVSPPTTCSDECLMTIESLQEDCEDGGTEFQVADDYFFYRIRVSGLNLPGNIWVASDGTSGQYGEEVVSMPHLFTEGTQTITILNEAGGECFVEFDIAPPRTEMICPAEGYRTTTPLQYHLFSGALTPGDITLDNNTDDCWRAGIATGNGVPYNDLIQFRTPEWSQGDLRVYHLFLFSRIPAPADLPQAAADGTGAIFIGNSYYEPDPCCFLQSHPARPAMAGELDLANPYVDTTGLFDAPMHLVRRFTLLLAPDQDYLLLTTTWAAGASGEYAWLVVDNGNAPLTPQNNVSDFQHIGIQNSGYDLTFADVDWFTDNPASMDMMGRPSFSPICGVDSLLFRDVVLESGVCEELTVTRTFEAISANTRDTCFQTVTFRRPLFNDIILPPRVALFTCGEDYEINEAGYPDPGAAGYPHIVTAGGIEVLENGELFNLTITYKDSELADTMLATTSVERLWTIVDACNNDTLVRFAQLIKIGEFSEPRIDCPLTNHYCPIVEEDIMLFNTDPFECTADVFIPWPALVGSCVEGEWYVVTEVMQIVGLDTIVIDSILPEDSRLLIDWPVGDYLLRYSATDEAGNRLERICRFRVADFQEPVAICRSDLNISLNGSGLNRIFTTQIDRNSYDNCGPVSLSLRRLYTRDPLTCDTLLTPYYSDWGPYIQVGCCDAGDWVTVEMRVTDIYGNINMCWMNVAVSDNTLPYCTGLANVNLSCDDLPAHFNPLDSLQRVALFGWPQVVDNCTAEAIELSPIIDLNHCGDGQIIRRFRAIDRVGNVSAAIFQQIIQIDYSLHYAIRFPKDTETNCLQNPDTLQLWYTGCDSLTVDYTDVELSPVGEECRFIERTYTVTNWCEWNGVEPAVVVSRNEDCDALQGEEHVWVHRYPDTSYIDRDSLILNNQPLAGERGAGCFPGTNPQGYWRLSSSSGRWQYTQRIKIFDSTEPIITVPPYEPFCTTTEACEERVVLPFTVTEACTPEAMNFFYIALDLGANGSIEQVLPASQVLSGTYPHYQLSGVFPIGTHRIEMGLLDGCENQATAVFSFSVVDCFINQPVCYSGLIVYLEELPPNTDIDEDGDLDAAAVLVSASQLASCQLDDCTGPLRFSLNRVGEQPDSSRQTIYLTCEDRYRVNLEVYVWDNAGNPYALQPDGSLGGPNSRFCQVEVLVQDTLQVCNDCVEEELLIEGSIYNIDNKAIKGVLVSLAGTLTNSLITGIDGHYVFGDLIEGGDYTVTPYKNDDTRNGLSALDVLLLQAHITGQIPITNPYKLVAADVNRSGTITLLDLVELQAILLGEQDTFQQNTSWRFIPTSIDLYDPANAWSDPISDGIIFSVLEVCQFDQDFIGVKIGDVNNTAETGSLQTDDELDLRGDTGANWPVYTPDTRMKAGEVYTLPIHATQLEAVNAFQFSLLLDPALVEIVGVESGSLNGAAVGRKRLSEGLLTALWSRTADAPASATIFSVVVRPKQDVRASEVLQLGSFYTEAMSFDRLNKAGKVALVFQPTATPGLVLDQNEPNPFTDNSSVRFYLPEAGEVRWEVQDPTGRILNSSTRYYNAGEHRIQLSAHQLPQGVYWYAITFNGQRLARRMVVMH